VRYLSLFSGIEAATLAAEPIGWTPVAFAEIADFPSRVLAHYWPDVPNLGDVGQITAERVRALGPIEPRERPRSPLLQRRPRLCGSGRHAGWVSNRRTR
jgi:hypothetical protein